MTCQATNSNGQKEEIELNSMSDIFTKDGIALKSIYVLGDAGAGKSSFCKSLVDYWCSAHYERQSSKDEFNGVKEMKKFDFLFYISLRHCKDVSSIQEMLEKQYKSDILTTLLDKESTKIIIVLDGLDEWCPVSVTSNQFQTEGLPELDNSKDFTIVTTSRPWKIATLAITDREVQKKLTLKGFDRSSSVKEMIDKSVPILNASFDRNKPQSDCEQKLANISLESIIQVPILLLQLICLWFDDKLENETSKCAIYTGILELFFSWNEKKKTVLGLFEEKREMSEDMQELPQYLIDRTTCKINKYLIHTLTRLAYATLFKNTKETSLTFDSSTFEQLEISDKVKICCLRLGILSEDKCPSLTTSTCKITVLSFVHKSVQEYLAAVHIAIMFRARLGSSADLKNVDISDQCTQFIKTYFSKCATLDAVLEQEDVIIMLCGLEPRIATSVSKYIYDVVTRDARVIEYRRTVHDVHRHSDLISNIQQCILNSIEEVQECQTGSQCNFYLGDVICWAFDYHLNQKFLGIKQYILPDSVRSYNLIFSDFNNSDAGVEYMHKCRGLEMIHIRGDIYSCMKLTDTLIEKTSTTDLNVSALKTLSVVFSHNEYCSPKCNMIKLHLPNMRHLVALELEDVTVTHDDLTSLCTFLSGTSQLEQISIVVDCECKNKHEVDLSNHQQLQYLG